MQNTSYNGAKHNNNIKINGSVKCLNISFSNANARKTLWLESGETTALSFGNGKD